MSQLSIYLPEDRRIAMEKGELLPDRTHGAALFADISGFTSLTEMLAAIERPLCGTSRVSI